MAMGRERMMFGMYRSFLSRKILKLNSGKREIKRRAQRFQDMFGESIFHQTVQTSQPLYFYFLNALKRMVLFARSTIWENRQRLGTVYIFASLPKYHSTHLFSPDSFFGGRILPFVRKNYGIAVYTTQSRLNE